MTPTVKWIAALLYREESRLEESKAALETAWGPMDFLSPPHPFDVTHYYEKEMSAPLFRRIASFEKTGSPSDLTERKGAAAEMEGRLKDAARNRTVNIDPGYLDYDKVVLASYKSGAYKLYLSEGVFGDMTLHYEKGHYHPFPWTFSDFKDGRYDAYFMKIRERFKRSLKPAAEQG